MSRKKRVWPTDNPIRSKEIRAAGGYARRDKLGANLGAVNRWASLFRWGYLVKLPNERFLVLKDLPRDIVIPPNIKLVKLDGKFVKVDPPTGANANEPDETATTPPAASEPQRVE